MTSTASSLQEPAPGRPWGDAQTLADVRPEVRKLFESSDAFARLPPEEREALAQQTVKVATYMANPDGLARDDIERGGLEHSTGDEPLAEAQADIKKGFAGKDFQAGAVKQGVEQYGQLVQKVDFPKFVSGLIKGVFQAIVDSSIAQMRAYGELIANVAKTVDQFAQDNITENNARDFLTQKYPADLGIGLNQQAGGFDAAAPAPATPAPQPTLTVTSQDPEAFLARVRQDMQITKELTDLSDPDQEQELVHSARLQIAKGRQQLLASMVMLGINRIVVTDGLINAKVVFSLRASDTATRTARASDYDENRSSVATHVDVDYDSWFSPVSAHSSVDARNDHITTVQSSLDETSTSQAEVNAKLTGEVRVNFKSDYLPLEKMANPAAIAAIQGNATPLDTTATVQRPGGATPPAAGTPAGGR